MDNKPKKQKNSDYPVDFRGAKLTQLEANRVGIGVFFGILGIVFVFFSNIEAKSILSYAVLLLFVIFGYFVVAPLIFKKRGKKDNLDKGGE